MDYDINNQQALTAGAFYQQQAVQQQDWRSMESAPMDGTIIEIRCTYGVAPWFRLFRWTSKRQMPIQVGDKTEMREWDMEPTWVQVGNDQSSVDGKDSTFMWRPYAGDITRYVDPTGGLQDSAAYWRGAVAQKYGLPLNYFEKEVTQNVAKDSPNPRPRERKTFWRWLFGLD